VSVAAASEGNVRGPRLPGQSIAERQLPCLGDDDIEREEGRVSLGRTAGVVAIVTMENRLKKQALAEAAHATVQAKALEEELNCVRSTLRSVGA